MNFKITLRFLRRNVTPTLVTVIGLTLSAAVSMLLFFYVNHEWHYDGFYPKKDREELTMNRRRPRRKDKP